MPTRLTRCAQPAVRAVLLVLLSLGAVPSTARGQSLAGVARKEEERRKTVQAPSKVYTNKDLNPVPAGSTPPAATKDGEKDKASADAKDKDKDGKGKDGKEPVKDQAYWSGRLKALDEKLLRDSNFRDAIQTRINALNTDFVNRDDPVQRAQVERDRQKAIAELGKLTKDQADDKKAISDLMEEARLAGVPPGWMR